jgi:hypothetical protein
MTPAGNQYLVARERRIPEIGYVLRSDAERKEALEDDLSARSLCSQQVKEIPTAARRKPLLCFITFSRGLLTHVAKAEVRYTAQSGWDRLHLCNLTEFDQPIRISGGSPARWVEPAHILTIEGRPPGRMDPIPVPKKAARRRLS